MANVKKLNDYTTVVEIDRSELEKIDFAVCKEPRETLSKFHSRQSVKPDYVLNGGFFNTADGGTIFSYKDESQVKINDYDTRWGIGIVGNSDLVYGDVNTLTNTRDFLAGFPVLLENGVIASFGPGKAVEGKHPRSAIGFNDTKLFLVTIDGRQTGKPGATLTQAAEVMKSLGCKYAINCDGGGSTRLIDKNANALNSPTENRAVDNVIAVYLKEEPKMPKVYLSPSVQENNVNKNVNFVEETEMNLITDILEVELQRHGVTTYRNDPGMSLYQIVTDSNSKNVDFHFAIHSNAGGGKGTEIYIYAKGGKAEQYAEKIYAEVASTTPTADRGIKVDSSLYETKNTKAPAALIEVDFHDNDTIAKWIQENRKPLAVAMCKGILKQLGITYVEEKPAEPVPAPAPNPDAPWYTEAQNWAIANGISDGSNPTCHATRAEVWQMLYNYEKMRQKNK